MRPLPIPLSALCQALTVGAVVLVLVNFFSFRSLWLDEAMLSLNLVDRSFAGLMAPLDWLQVAPIGFLWAEKAALSVFGAEDWALRLVPLLAYATSVPLCYAFSRKLLDTKPLALLATAIYANGYIVCYYATEVKQYMVDGVVALGILLVGLAFARHRSLGTAMLFGAFGVACVWLSNVAVVMLFTTGLYLLYQVREAPAAEVTKVLLSVTVWALGFVGYYAAFIHENPNQPGMMGYWEKFGVFLPYDVASVAFWEQLWLKVQVTGKVLCQYRRFGLPFLGVAAYGGWAFAKTDQRALYLLTAPILVHLGLAYLKLYPFEVRMVLYVAPMLSVLLAKGLDAAYRQSLTRSTLIHPGAMALVPLLLFGLNLNSTALEVEEVKPALAHLAAEVQQDDVVYVYSQSRPAVEFYLRDYPGLAQRAKFVYGSDGERDWRAYDDDLRRLPRLDWVLFTGPPGLLEEEGYGLESYVVCLAAEGGLGVAEERRFTGASVYRLSAPTDRQAP